MIHMTTTAPRAEGWVIVRCECGWVMTLPNADVERTIVQHGRMAK